MTVGEKIKKLRTEKAMTQSELAGNFITRNMLSLIESGAAQPSLPTIKYLAERLNVPVGILIEDDKYEYFYRRVSSMENIRRAFLNKDYRICLDFCRKTESDIEDNELDLIKAECFLGIAKEDFSDGRLKKSCVNFDKACEYAEKTIYNALHILSEAKMYCNYMRTISPSLFADCADNAISFEMSMSDEFCRYVSYLSGMYSNTDIDNVSFENVIYQDHIKSRLAIENGDYETAYKLMTNILNGSQSVPGPIMYDIFKDLEVCCRELGDFKGAYEYSGDKVIMLEKLLSDDLF